MSTPTQRDIEHVFEQLRKGVVPERALETFAVGIEAQRTELHRQLEFVQRGEGNIKFLRGGYGCGKTFMSRLAVLDAQARGFATSFVVVSDNDLKFHKFDDVYKKVLTELGTSSCPRGALGDILDRWIGSIEEGLIDAGEDEDAPGFDGKVRERLNSDIMARTSGQAPGDFVRVIQTIFDLKQEGNVAEAAALISWLSGSSKVAASAKKAAQIKGEIQSRDALDYLRGVLEIVKAAGYKGMLIVIDEAETILRMRTDIRHKSLNGIRQIADASGSYPGLLWIFTGTPEFFDERRGVAGLAPLHDRIAFENDGGFASLKQPQLELRPFDGARLRGVALRLREYFPTEDRARLEKKVPDAFIDRLVDKVTEGFAGDVGVVPRQFLRQFVSVMDKVEQYPDYDPFEQYSFTADALTSEEQQVLSPSSTPLSEIEDESVPHEDVW